MASWARRLKEVLVTALLAAAVVCFAGALVTASLFTLAPFAVVWAAWTGARLAHHARSERAFAASR